MAASPFGILALGRAVKMGGDGLGEGLDAGQWSAQFVRGVGEELPGLVGGAAGSVLGVLEGVEHVVELGRTRFPR